jgi:OOP family OmpA-OmpF porin
MVDIVPLLNKNVRIEIKGHADRDGSTEHNLRLSQARANTILSALVSRKIEATYFTAVGVGTKEPWQQNKLKANQEMERRVSFKVFLTDAL